MLHAQFVVSHCEWTYSPISPGSGVGLAKPWVSANSQKLCGDNDPSFWTYSAVPPEAYLRVAVVYTPNDLLGP